MIKEKKQKIFNFFNDIYGIGPIRAKKLIILLGLKDNTSIYKLNLRKRYAHFLELLENKNVGISLRRNFLTHLYKLKRRRTYRGLRASAKLLFEDKERTQMRVPN